VKLEGVPEGYEAVKIGVPSEGELFINTYGDVDSAWKGFKESRLIVRKVEPIATWKHGVFADCWIAEDECGEIYAWKKRPKVQADEWQQGEMLTCVSDGLFRDSIIKFREDLPWTERCVQVGPSVENQQ
jgi:hypothetical protein